ncbi:MAG: hypothetical protein ACSLE1_19975 [Sphingobium sp.]
MIAYARAAFALGLPLLLSACLLTPGKFDSTLDIRADRSFTFTYKGEVIATDLSDMTRGLDKSGTDEPSFGNESGEGDATGDDAVMQNIAWQGEDFGNASETGDKKADNTAKMEAIAAALTKEKGFRAATYLGNNKFAIDYAITSTLTHGFVFPFNTDAEIMFPFIIVELRGDDRVRVKAPGYANGADKQKSSSMMGSGSGDDASKFLDGRFTLTTNAEIVSQNQEDGPISVPGGKQVTWTVSPLTKDAPMAVIRFPTK